VSMAKGEDAQATHPKAPREDGFHHATMRRLDGPLFAVDQIRGAGRQELAGNLGAKSPAPAVGVRIRASTSPRKILPPFSG
jgi:hypothetical protein